MAEHGAVFILGCLSWAFVRLREGSCGACDVVLRRVAARALSGPRILCVVGVKGNRHHGQR